EVDTLVFDIQDIGARYYTYVSTMRLAMEAAAEHGKSFVVLDRPNPINGVDVDGPMLDPGRESFVASHRLPVRHGMTIGELAKMFVAELKLEIDLQVVAVEGWQRADVLDLTGLPWVNPSPNIRCLNQAILYPGIGLLETTNLSVGRGTDTPFERFGAPWINAVELAMRLNAQNLAGIRFTPIRFSPETSVFANQECQGVQLSITNRQKLSPLDVGLVIATTLRTMYPNDWQVEKYDRLLGNAQVLEAVRSGATLAQIRQGFEPDVQAFRTRRAAYLLY
ncbi:MAG: DUF1343 domain-containing protein, partial [Planctomycetales bacterium]|nr:DUF1343 domain-containing protein [Planctomycetales bacterium]